MARRNEFEYVSVQASASLYLCACDLNGPFSTSVGYFPIKGRGLRFNKESVGLFPIKDRGLRLNKESIGLFSENK